ncbi:mechanosensitive ion channel domain-containing protein [Desulfobulbus sp.]|uniref:mechanosensitive ion channel domain-containing protein n=1 Tax=Desulfobulbus sp. TaxID=895 RepID=UPI00286F4CD4|nr:mechanosensitive ion channel domain-containing protein [Desulfobulbus sp.]
MHTVFFRLIFRNIAPILLLLPLFLGAGVLAPRSAGAAEPSSPATALTPEFLKAKISESGQMKGLEESIRNKLLELYRQSLDNLETATANNAQADRYVRDIETVPAETRKIRAERERLAHATPLPGQENAAAAGKSAQETEQDLLKAKSQAATLDAQVSTLTRQLAAQNNRPIQISQRLTELKKAEQTLLSASKQPTAQAAPQLAEAMVWLRQSQLSLLHSETKMLQQESVSMPVQVDLTTAQLEEAITRREQANALAQQLESLVNRQRQDEAAKSAGQAEEAVRQLSDSAPALKQAAAVNATLGEALKRLTASLEQVTAEKEALGKQFKTMDERFKATKLKYELAGWNQAVGLVLEEQRRSLPDQNALRKKMADNEAAIAEVGLFQVQYAEERRQLEQNGADPQPSAALSETGAEELKHLLASRGELLKQLMELNQTVLGLRAESDALYRQLDGLVSSFRAFLAERLLWVRSTPPMRLSDFSHLLAETAAFCETGQWLATGRMLSAQLASSPLLVAALLLGIAIHAGRRRLRHRLQALIDEAVNPITYSFFLPLQALLLTVLLALPLPLLLQALGWGAHTLPASTDFSRGVAAGLIDTSHRLFLLAWFRLLLLPHGLAIRFFRWPQAVVEVLLRGTVILLHGFLPAVLLTQMAFAANYHSGNSFILGRVLFIVAICGLAFALFRIFHPRTGVWQNALTSHAHRLASRFYLLFFLVTMLLPVVFGAVVIAGFVVAVGSLMSCLFNSFWVLVGTVVTHQLIEQWLMQSSRKLALRSNLTLRQAPASGQGAGQPAAAGQQAGQTVEHEVDLVELSANSRKLLNVMAILGGGLGLWLVWADVLPALRIFDNLVLWKYSATVDGQKTLVDVTLADAGLSLFIGFLTLTASRHLPALLNIVLLQQLELNPGSRYTATTLSRYAIAGIGSLLVADTLGFRWEQIQWLVAALGVGIGFGLQEIVANFISGLILLFERPIRVGDVVTVGGTDGVVTRIRIRATTIRDFDRKELLVPNKEFISGHLLNWSLSDPVTRIMIPVGLAYGNDVRRAMQLMQEAAEQHPQVLDEPRAMVTFDSFGDNALLLNLRCFIGSVDNRVRIKSALHLAIDDKFRQAGLCMAFPQRDVHLDAPTPFTVRIVREELPADETPTDRPATAPTDSPEPAQ